MTGAGTHLDRGAHADRPGQPSRAARSSVVELRRYALHPGGREVLIELFQREFVESQEALGIEVIGQFRDRGDPNRFVWLRGFPDMATRARALEAFYGGPIWKEHRDAANATMVDSDDVLLLRPAAPSSGFFLEHETRRPVGADAGPEGLVVATICSLDAPAGADLVELFEADLEPELTAAGASIAGSFVTESSVNTFPALPVREGEHVFAWFSCFPDRAAYEQSVSALAGSRRWHEVSSALARRLTGDPEVLELAPTSRSLLRG